MNVIQAEVLGTKPSVITTLHVVGPMRTWRSSALRNTILRLDGFYKKCTPLRTRWRVNRVWMWLRILVAIAMEHWLWNQEPHINDVLCNVKHRHYLSMF